MLWLQVTEAQLSLSQAQKRLYWFTRDGGRKVGPASGRDVFQWCPQGIFSFHFSALMFCFGLLHFLSKANLFIPYNRGKESHPC